MNNNLYEHIELKRQQLLKASSSQGLSSAPVLKISQELDKLLNQYDKQLKHTSYN